MKSEFMRSDFGYTAIESNYRRMHLCAMRRQTISHNWAEPGWAPAHARAPTGD